MRCLKHLADPNDYAGGCITCEDEHICQLCEEMHREVYDCGCCGGKFCLDCIERHEKEQEELQELEEEIV